MNDGVDVRRADAPAVDNHRPILAVARDRGAPGGKHALLGRPRQGREHGGVEGVVVGHCAPGGGQYAGSRMAAVRVAKAILTKAAAERTKPRPPSLGRRQTCAG